MLRAEVCMNQVGKHVIVGVHITDRVKHVRQVQQVFTEYGCQIKTRLGLHDAGTDFCSPNGLILLEMIGPASSIAAMVKKLKAVKGVDAKRMVFSH